MPTRYPPWRTALQRLRPSRRIRRSMGQGLTSASLSGTGNARVDAFLETVVAAASALQAARKRYDVLSDEYEAEARSCAADVAARMEPLRVEDFGTSVSEAVAAASRTAGKRAATDAPIPVSYVHGDERPDWFSIGVFVLPPRACLPPHDHFGLVVVSKLLYGTAEISALDFLPDASSPQPGRPVDRAQERAQLAQCHLHGGPAATVVDHATRHPGDIWSLFPKAGGNVHCITATEREPCAMLDVLLPPYPRYTGWPVDAASELHDCHYYRATAWRPEADRQYLERLYSDAHVIVRRTSQPLFATGSSGRAHHSLRR
eukprot:ctg_3496.g597